MYKYFNLFDLKQKVNYKTEVLSGLTVAMALVPEAVAFALIAGLSPLTGLYAAFIMGIVDIARGHHEQAGNQKKFNFDPSMAAAPIYQPGVAEQ